MLFPLMYINPTPYLTKIFYFCVFSFESWGSIVRVVTGVVAE
jgi:hypothetical protein